MREQEIIRKIIDMDKAAREATHDAMERRTRTAHAADKKKQEVTDTFISMARNRVDVIRNTEVQHAAAQLAEGNKQREAVAERIDRQYETHREEWVNAIVSRVIDGDDLL